MSLLPEIITLCKTYETMLMLDDAHGIGVMGANGRGTAEYYNCLGQIDIITGTFSKSFGCDRGICSSFEEDNTILEILCGQQCVFSSPYPTSHSIHTKSFRDYKKRTTNKNQTLGKYELS